MHVKNEPAAGYRYMLQLQVCDYSLRSQLDLYKLAGYPS